MATALSVNLNKIALLRNSREGNYPCLEEFGKRYLELGAQGLTVHPRPDQRHIRASDVPVIANLIARYVDTEFNIEGNPFAAAQGSYPGLLKLVEQSRPHQCTLVPDSNAQLTSDHGFNLKEDSERLKPIVEQLNRLGVRISLFMDPDVEQIQLAKDLGVQRIELYTGPFAWAIRDKSADAELIFEKYKKASKFAQSIGIGVNAGHDLSLENLSKFLNIPNILEVSIGHAMTVDSLLMGIEAAFTQYLEICQK